MLKIKKHGIIIKPTTREFENLSTFNPGIYQEGEYVHVFYRSLSQKFISSIGYAKLKGPTTIVERWKKPLYYPEAKYEKKGMEDPRIVKIGDTFYVTYVAHDGRNAVINYLHGKDLRHLRRGGIISPKISYRKISKLFQYSNLKDQYYFLASYYEKYAHKNVLVWEKDGVMFPEKFHGRFLMLHRILPDIQLIRFKNFSELRDNNFWIDYTMHLSKHVVLEGVHGWEGRHIGAGAPPVKTKKGWLIIYHGVEQANKGRVYRAGAALLDLKNPNKLIARLPDPLFSPEDDWETHGHVHNAIFPTGTAIFKDRLYIYYGAADSFVSAASVNLNELLKELLKNKV